MQDYYQPAFEKGVHHINYIHMMSKYKYGNPRRHYFQLISDDFPLSMTIWENVPLILILRSSPITLVTNKKTCIEIFYLKIFITTDIVKSKCECHVLDY